MSKNLTSSVGMVGVSAATRQGKRGGAGAPFQAGAILMDSVKLNTYEHSCAFFCGHPTLPVRVVRIAQVYTE